MITARRHSTEILVGAFMAAGLGALLFLVLQVSNLGAFAGGPGYEITARFANVGGLRPRAAVRMAGVRIGRVEAIVFDKERYEAVVSLHIDQQFDTIPMDSFASVFTAGLLGEQYVGLEPGGSEEFLREGDEIGHTQSALVLEQVVGQLIFSKAEEGSQ